MKENLNNILTKVGPTLEKFRRYRTFTFIVVILCFYSYLIFNINSYSTREPSEDEVTAKLQTVPHPRVDEEVVDKLNKLQDNSSSVKALFNSARDNPFSE